ncbi:ProQ/FINO family protein [Pseudoalteromonas umbrosa]|uniref:ProQ/FINO family protein n=1 Tax=Pseudoalteromonas umbrosa TaxID=3048489 RepID=UPI0024C357F3|nr:ProQ/FINO family protein [Pseudoalteromonas sp. B95]MDK1290087.1 ProQ/FINO family protein [Pseudoalteromonas sp. B95]
MKNHKNLFFPEQATSAEPHTTEPLYADQAAYEGALFALKKDLLRHFPMHFGKNSQPWSVGIREQLIKHYQSKGYPPALVIQALHFEARSINYRVNCMLAGVNAARIGLDGQADGCLSRQEFIYNLMQLSGLVRRKDKKQSWAYKEWALRETVLGLVRNELTRESLIAANLKSKFVELCVRFANDPQAIEALALKNKRSGALHPAVYGAPYIPDELFNAFKRRHHGHITAGKKKPKRIQLVTENYKLCSLLEASVDKASLAEPKTPKLKTPRHTLRYATSRQSKADNSTKRMPITARQNAG